MSNPGCIIENPTMVRKMYIEREIMTNSFGMRSAVC
ncbi:MAG: hypothetical protein ACJAUW_001801, partial [Yoonia sp.]